MTDPQQATGRTWHGLGDAPWTERHTTWDDLDHLERSFATIDELEAAAPTLDELEAG